MSLTYGEVCAGVGGIGLGLERAGMRGKWAIEMDPACQRVLKRNWPDLQVFGDVTGVESDSLRRVELVAGGTPCQDLSGAGQRAGLVGEKSRLFFEFTRIITDLAPDWIFWENVPGVLSSNSGDDFAAVLGHLTGYFPEVPDGGWRNSGICTGPAYKVAWRVLDAQYFGVPQRRNRVFIVGHIRDATRAAEVLFESDCVSGDSKTGDRPRSSQCDPSEYQDSIGNRIKPLVTKNRNSIEDETLIPVGFAPQVGGNNDVSSTLVKNGIPISILPTLTCSQETAVAFAENQRGEIRSQTLIPSPTAAGGKPGQGYAAVLTSTKLRRLTPLERERAQGWPDNWTAGESDTARLRMTGNGVCSNVAEWIGKRIMENQ